MFLASPGDVGAERECVRRFFEEYNLHTTHIWNVRFDVVDWENYATIGVGRPQKLVTQQTLEKHRDSIALAIGIMAQRFGSSGRREKASRARSINSIPRCSFISSLAAYMAIFLL